MWLLSMLLTVSITKAITLEGDYVCPQQERYTVNVTRTVLKKVKIRNYKWCANFPPRCSYYTDEEKYVPETVEQEEIHTVDACCSGYEVDKEGKKCVPQCPICVHGECTENNKCNCHAGFWGELCDTECPPTRWGRNCETMCLCEKGDCDSVTGYCTCPPGWKGNRCEEFATITPINNTTAAETSSESSIMGVIDQRNRLRNSSERVRYPAFQKYYTFYITTEKPSPTAKHQFDHPNEVENLQQPQDKSSNQTSGAPVFPSPQLTSITLPPDRNLEVTTIYGHNKTFPTNTQQRADDPATQRSAVTDTVPVPVAHVTTVDSREDVEAKQERELTDKMAQQVTSVTQPSHGNMKAKVASHGLEVSVTSTQPISPEEDWLEDERRAKQEDGRSIHRNQKSINETHLVFSVGVVAGVMATVAFIVAVALFSSQRYRRKKPPSIVSGAAASKRDNGDNEAPTVSIYTRSVFHAPLPDPPVFENPVFTTPLELDSYPNEFGRTLETRVICSMHLANGGNCKQDSRIVDAFYDHPPSTGSYRAASIPEPPDMSLEAAREETKEHLYDEIPCWKQPRLPVAKSSSAEALALYTNTSSHMKTKF